MGGHLPSAYDANLQPDVNVSATNPIAGMDCVVLQGETPEPSAVDDSLAQPCDQAQAKDALMEHVDTGNAVAEAASCDDCQTVEIGEEQERLDEGERRVADTDDAAGPPRGGAELSGSIPEGPLEEIGRAHV